MKASLRDVVVSACNLSSWEAFLRKEGGSLMGTFLLPPFSFYYYGIDLVAGIGRTILYYMTWRLYVESD